MSKPPSTATTSHHASEGVEVMRSTLPRRLTHMVLLNLGIALLITAIGDSPKGFWINLVYSFCVGGTCWAVVDGGRVVLAHVVALKWPELAAAPMQRRLENRPLVLVPLALLCVLVGPPVGLTLADLITGHQSPSLFDMTGGFARVVWIISLLASVVSVTVFSLLGHLAGAKAQAESARRAAAENQLKLLESQLEPHMLFNTLANLRVLIALDPPRAQAMLDQLIGFLRATLNASRSGSHSLAAEFERIGDYLALMGMRMGPRLAIELDLPAELRELQVPPLLLQPLVENSIKHGLEPKVEGGRVEVRAQRLGHTLRLTVRDTGLGMAAGGAGHASAHAGTGFGMVQVRERLAALHGGKALFTLRSTDDAEGGCIAQIDMPISA